MIQEEIAAPPPGEAAGEIKEPFLVSNELLSDPPALRARMADQGYLFLRGLIPAEEIAAVRHEILGTCAEAGWLRRETAVNDGIVAEGLAWREPQPEYMEVYDRVQQSEKFHALARHKALISALDTLFGEPTLAHPRNIARIVFPNNTLHTTPSHQDYIHIQGTEATYTVWMPLCDCPKELGSLVVLPGSQRGGVLPVHRAYGAGGVGIDTEALPYRWTGSDFAMGDVLIFHSLTVHKALPNLSADRIRLSVDYRYQPLSHPVDASSLLPHYNRASWDEIYANWGSKAHQYYWRDLPLHFADRDARVQELRKAADGA